MGIKTIEVYDFEELTEEAKEKVLQNYKDNMHNYSDVQFYLDDAMYTTEQGLLFFEAELNDYSVDPYNMHGTYFNVGINDDIDKLEGARLYKYLTNNYNETYNKDKKKKVKLEIWQSDCLLSGVCYDFDFFSPIIEFMKRPYDITFKELLTKCCFSVAQDVEKEAEYEYTDESIIERIEVNDVKFLKNGKIFSL